MQQQLMKKEVMILKENKKGSTEGFKGVKGKREWLYYNLKKKMLPHKKTEDDPRSRTRPLLPRTGLTNGHLFCPLLASSKFMFLSFLFFPGWRWSPELQARYS